MESRNKITPIIFLELLALISLIIICGYNLNKLNKLKTNLQNIQIEDIKEDTNTKEELKFYQNLEQNIISKKEEYYQNIEKLETKIKNGETDTKIAYLTFDDGPYDLTQKYLDILKENNIRATFFVLGKEEYEETYKRIVSEGHTLANHTYYHNIKNGLYNSADSFINQVEKLEEYLYNITGYKTSIVRFPGGSPTAGNLKKEIEEKLHDRGYNYVDWTCETGDGSSAKLAQKGTYEWFIDTKKDQKIIVLLMHDYNYSTYENLQTIINKLKEENFIFLPLTNHSTMVK